MTSLSRESKAITESFHSFSFASLYADGSPEDLPDDSFHSPLTAMLSVFVLLTSENYPSVRCFAWAQLCELLGLGGYYTVQIVWLGVVVFHARSSRLPPIGS